MKDTRIHHITKHYWTQPDGKAGYCYWVFYKRPRNRGWDRRRLFTFDANLPKTVLDYLLNADAVETRYTERWSPNGTYKIETYTMKEANQ